MLSVVIPTLNAADDLPACLLSLATLQPLIRQTIVADGGSTDTTVDIARSHGAFVCQSMRGRGLQLADGAAAATAPWLLFLHADTALAPGWDDAVRRFIDDPQNRGRAGVFRFALDDGSRAARQLEAMVGWRCRVLALPYGDQGLLMSRVLYDEIGGYAKIPLMEDVNIIQRVGRRRLVCLDAVATTSARRYIRDGWRWRSARNFGCLGLYYLGVPPRIIDKLYH